MSHHHDCPRIFRYKSQGHTVPGNTTALAACSRSALEAAHRHRQVKLVGHHERHHTVEHPSELPGTKTG